MSKNLEVEMQFSDILHVAFIFQGLSFSLFLFFTRRGKLSVNIILGLLLLCLSLHMILNLMEPTLTLRILRLNNTFGFLYGPLIWLYIYHLIHSSGIKNVYYLLLFVPFAISSCILYVTNFRFFGPLIALQTLVYLIACVRSIHSYQSVIKETNANSAISLSWLYQFVGAVVLLFFFDIVRNIITIEDPILGTESLYMILIIMLIVMVNLLVFKSLNHSSKFLGISDEEKEIGMSIGSLELDRDEIISVARTIQNFTIDTAVFKRAELNLNDFAELVGHPARLVSQVINSYFQTNFSDWINDHRLDYAKQLLEETTSKEKNISQVLYESGFNSVSSFYHVFSKKVGMSPTAYRNQFRGGV